MTVPIRFMALLALIMSAWHVQAQSTCATATGLVGNDTIYKNRSLVGGDIDQWFSFVPQTNNVAAYVHNLRDTSYASIVRMELYSGSCAGLSLMASDTINKSLGTAPLFVSSNTFSIGVTYYLKITKGRTARTLARNQDSALYNIGLRTLQVCSFAQDPCDLVQNGSFEQGSTINYISIFTPTGWGYFPNNSPCLNSTAQNSPDIMDANTTAPAGACTFNGPNYPENGVPGDHYTNCSVQAERTGKCRYAHIGAEEEFYGSLTGNFYPFLNYELNYYHSVPEGRLSILTASSNVVESNLLIGASCANRLNLNTTAPLTSTTYTANWNLISRTFTLTPAQCAAGYNKIEFKYKYGQTSGPTGTQNSLFFDDISIKAKSINAGPGKILCTGQTYTLGIPYTVPGGTFSYSWTSSPPDASLAGQQTQLNPVVSPTSTTTYSLYITNASGCTLTPGVVTLTVVPTPFSVTASASPTTACLPIGTSVTLTAVASPTNSTYAWSNGGGGAVKVIQAGTDGALQSVTATSSLGCTAIATVTVSHLPIINVQLTPTLVCSGQTATLQCFVGGGGTISWSNGASGFQQTVSPTVTTVYTASVTTPYGCAGTGQTTLAVVPSNSVLVSMSPSQFCSGQGSATLTAMGPTSFTWNTGATTSSIVVSPTVTTAYSVSGAGGCGNGTGSATVTVNQPPAISLSSAFNGCPSATTLTPFGASTYTWLPGGQTTTNIAVTPTIATTYTVTGTNAAGCTGSNTITVQPMFCCTQGTLFVATQGNFNGGGGVYYLNGPIALSGDLSISKATIFMGSNAEIIVPHGRKLTINNQVHLLGCPNMWKGIRMVGPRGSVIVTEDCLIEDAITAISAKGISAPSNTATPSVIMVVNSTFNKNFTAIDVENSFDTLPYKVDIRGTVFTCRKLVTNDHSTYLGAGPVTYTWNPPVGSTASANMVLKNTSFDPATMPTGGSVGISDQFSAGLFPSSNLGVPYSSSISRYGVYLKDVNAASSYQEGVTIGDYGSDLAAFNLMDNLNYGVYAVNAHVQSNNTGYQNMREYRSGSLFGMPLYEGGAGIYSTRTGTANIKLSVEPPPGVNTQDFRGNVFFHNVYGVKATNIQDVSIKYNTFHTSLSYPYPMLQSGTHFTGQSGVDMQTGNWRNIQVSYNYMTNMVDGFVFKGDYVQQGTVVSQNRGILTTNYNVIQANYSGKSGGSISTGITMDNLMNCATCTFSVNPTAWMAAAQSNTISNAFRGIKASNWKMQTCSSSSNKITLANEGGTSTQYGVLHENCGGDIINSNTITGPNMTKTQLGAVWARDNANQAMYCNGTDNSYYGFQFSGAMNATAWKNSGMTNHARGMYLNNTIIGLQGSPYQASGNQWNGIWTGTNFQTYVGAPTVTNSSNSKLFVGSGSTTNPTNNGFQINGTEYLAGSSIITTTNAPSGICPAPTKGTNAAVIKLFEKVITADLDYGDFTTIQRINAQHLLYRYAKIDPAVQDSSDPINVFVTTGDMSIMRKLLQIEEAIMAGNISLANEFATYITTSNVVEENQRRVYTAHIAMLNNTYNEDYDANLLALANGCPEKHGIGVYQARTLYNTIHQSNVLFEDDCDAKGAKLSGKQQSGISDNYAPLKVFPNPNEGSFYIDTRESDLNNMQIRVYDINGRMVYNQQVTQEKGEVYKLDLNADNGIYLLEVTDLSNGKRFHQKLVVQQ